MNWKYNSKIIEQTDMDYLHHNKIYPKRGLFILLLDTAFKITDGNLEYAILRYIENAQTVSSIKVQFFQYKPQNYIILYFLHVPYSFISNSPLGLMSLAKCLRL